MKRYSKKVREEAALICAIAASGGVHSRGEMRRRNYCDIADNLGFGFGSSNLALSAWSAVRDLRVHRETDRVMWHPAVDAEAERLLLDGWVPGRPLQKDGAP